MDWDTDHDPSIASTRGGWPDPAELAGALMAVPSLSDSLAAAQATSPARKRKLFGSQGTLSPGRVIVKNASPSGRQLANLPSAKRARMSHSHPLSRSPASAPRQLATSASSLLRQPSHSPQVRRSPSPVQIIRSQGNVATSTNLLPTCSTPASGALTPDERTCISCRRTATSLLQLAKFHKCSLCGGLSCPVCSRTCQSGDEAEIQQHKRDRRSASIEDVNLSDNPQDQTEAAGSSTQACGKPVCRGCSVESADGVVQCYRCHTMPPS